MAISYGTGTATQFTDGSARQVLELGKKIHYYNPSVTPILTVGGRASTRNTPVPIFEWMEDEYNFKKSIKFTTSTVGTNLLNSADGLADGEGCIITLDRQAQMELFEVGGLYKFTHMAGTNTHGVCVATGVNCNVAADNNLNVQFVAGTVAGSTFTHVSIADTGGPMIDASQALEIIMVGRINSKSSVGGKHPSAWMTENEDADGIANAETASFAGLSGYAEGADIGEQTSKKVRRLKNCTQIFREPYMITGTAKAAKHYGGSELSRLQARKLNKIKTDIEWAILTNGDTVLDATAENPQRTFGGFGLGEAAGVGFCKSNDGRDNTALQLDESECIVAGAAALDSLDSISEALFQDMSGGSMKKTVFCSNKWIKLVTKAARNVSGAQLTMEMGKETTAGLRVMSYLGAIGELEFIPHPLLNSHLEDYAVAIDFANFDWRPLAGRNLKLRKDVVKNGQDGQTDEWLIEAGCEIRNEQTHAILTIN